MVYENAVHTAGGMLRPTAEALCCVMSESLRHGVSGSHIVVLSPKLFDGFVLVRHNLHRMTVGA